MNTPLGRGRIWCLVLASALVLLAFPGGAQAQDRWKEVGLSGMALREVVSAGGFHAWPGFALNFGSWRRGYGFEGNVLFFAAYPCALGGSFIVFPSRTKKVIPYASAGALVTFPFVFEAEVEVIMNAGIGLKFALGPQNWFRAELRYMSSPGNVYLDTNLAICVGFYVAVGRRPAGKG